MNTTITDLGMTKDEISYLRELSGKYMEIATLPMQKEKRDLWKKLNRCDSTRPMVVIDQLPTNELAETGELTNKISDPFFNKIETQLLSAIYQFNHFPVDMVVEPYILIPKSVKNSGYGIGIDEDVRQTDSDNSVVSHLYTNQIQTYEDIEKIKDMEITHNEQESALWLDKAAVLFDGIAPIKQSGGILFHAGVWDTLSMLMGIEDIYFDLVDRPEFVHAIMDRITTSVLAGVKQANELGVHNDIANTSHCSYVYNDDLLPDFGAGKGSTSNNSWTMAMAQLFSSASPQTTMEFEIEYIKRISKEFGMLYYGCCERLDDRLDFVQTLPNLKKVSCSPWNDRENFAAKLNKGIVMSNKPNPAYLATATFDEDLIRDDLTRTYEAAKANNTPLEFILKDISTVHHQPERITRWGEIAMEVASK